MFNQRQGEVESRGRPPGRSWKLGAPNLARSRMAVGWTCLRDALDSPRYAKSVRRFGALGLAAASPPRRGLAFGLLALLTKPQTLGEGRALGTVARGHQWVVRGQAPLLAVLVGRETLHREMPAKGLVGFPVFEADQRIRCNGLADLCTGQFRLRSRFNLG